MTNMATKKARQTKDRPGPFHDILDTASILSSSEIPEKVIETVITDLCERLGKRARCALLEGNDLRLRFWAGEHSCPIGGVSIRENSIVWDVVRKGKPVNITDAHQSDQFEHSLGIPINVKSIIPLSYVDPLSKQQKNFGALIVDSGKEGVPISSEDFEYLQVIGQLISAIVGRKELILQLMQSCRRQEAILMEAAHNFRNNILVIGGFSRRIAKLAKNTKIIENAIDLQQEVSDLERHFAEFEKYMNLKT
jgi:GAF domain-containing protein